jgi:23S rRNA (cytidine1920-2'-O)/16S rRNA (cytidine1409-2'-O)-methyltransferase
MQFMKSPGKTRADQLLVARGLAESRTKAQALIMAGVVYSGERRIEKPGDRLAEDIPLELREKPHPWVSRGGVKLAHGLDCFDIDPTSLTAIDIGASTGGFTDVLLSRGAARVHAVDVGRGQLDWKLRQDARVVIHEGLNARTLTAEHIPDPVDLVVCDASFIGLEKVLPAALALTRPGARLVALIKPQFQAGRRDIAKGGVVRDTDVHARVCEEVRTWLESEMAWRVLGVEESPIRGPKGNVEFLIAAVRD